MKSYDIFVDRRLIQGDLIVVDLPLRNDIAAYDYIEIDSSVKKLLGEKALIFPVDATRIDVGSYLGVGYESTGAQKFEEANSSFVIGASADSVALSLMKVAENSIVLDSEAQEISQKIERALSDVAIGVNGEDAFTTAKSVGNIRGVIVFDANVAGAKQSFPKPDNDSGVIIGAVLIPPAAEYYEKWEAGVRLGANIKSLGYLSYLRLIRNEVNIGVEPVNAEPLFSLGKCNARISIGSEVATVVQFFTDAESAMDILLSGEPVLYMICEPGEAGILLGAIGAAILRRFRTLAETDAIGTLGELDNMTLEDIDYLTIEE